MTALGLRAPAPRRDWKRLARRHGWTVGIVVLLVAFAFYWRSATTVAWGPFDVQSLAIDALPLVQQCWRISGDADFLLKCVAASVEEMSRQLRQFAAMADVRTIRSFPVLGVSKDALLPVPGEPATPGPSR